MKSKNVSSMKLCHCMQQVMIALIA